MRAAVVAQFHARKSSQLKFSQDGGRVVVWHIMKVERDREMLKERDGERQKEKHRWRETDGERWGKP